MILKGSYLPGLPLPYVPASDGCGEVAEVGDAVTRFRVGDRVIRTYTQGWIDGLPTPEMRARRTAVRRSPDSCKIPWWCRPKTRCRRARPPLRGGGGDAADRGAHCLVLLQEGDVKPGDWVLVEGTGGWRSLGSSSPSSPGRVWWRSRPATTNSTASRHSAPTPRSTIGRSRSGAPLRAKRPGGARVDIVVETGGAPTLPQALAAATFGGFIGVVGFVGGLEARVDVRRLIGPMVRVQGIAVGSSSRFEAMNRAVDAHGLKPAVECVFPLERAGEAFALLERGGHFGKIAVSLAK